MISDTLLVTPAVESTASDFATFGAVHLDVTDGERALQFWRDLVGLERLAAASWWSCTQEQARRHRAPRAGCTTWPCICRVWRNSPVW